MQAILLKRKCDSMPCDAELVVFDELVTGVLSAEYFIPVFANAHNGMRMITLSFLLEYYLWPRMNDKVMCNIYYFICGNRPLLRNQFEFYTEENSIEL